MEWYYILGIVVAAVIFLLILLKIYIKTTTGMNRCSTRLNGKTVIVTGANTGIGYEAAKEFAHRGARVILACRDLTKACLARDRIAYETLNPDVTVRIVDMTSLNSIRNFASDILSNEKRIDILVNNAGAYGRGNAKTEDGLQTLMQVNHFGPFLLTNLLLDRIRDSAPSRIILVSSKAHTQARIDLDDINMEKRFLASRLYGNTKLCNIAFANELSRRMEKFGVTVNSLHPGVIMTDLWRGLPGIIKTPFEFILKMFFKNAEEGAQTTVFLAVSPEVELVTGRYFADCKEVSPSRLARDAEFSKKLWDVSERCVNLVGQERHLDVRVF